MCRDFNTPAKGCLQGSVCHVLHERPGTAVVPDASASPSEVARQKLSNLTVRQSACQEYGAATAFAGIKHTECNCAASSVNFRVSESSCADAGRCPKKPEAVGIGDVPYRTTGLTSFVFTVPDRASLSSAKASLEGPWANAIKKTCHTNCRMQIPDTLLARQRGMAGRGKARQRGAGRGCAGQGGGGVWQGGVGRGEKRGLGWF